MDKNFKSLINTVTSVIHEKTGDKEEYQKFFKSALKKFGVESPAELKGEKEKEFYDYIDKNWEGDNETDESVDSEVQNNEAIKEAKFDKLSKKLGRINPETLGDVLSGKIKLSPAEKKEFDEFMKDARKLFGVKESTDLEEVNYPHKMYDPESGKEVEVKDEDEHNKYADKGWTHEKPKTMDEETIKESALSGLSVGLRNATKAINSIVTYVKPNGATNKAINNYLDGKYDSDFKEMHKHAAKIESIWADIEYDYAMQNEEVKKKIEESLVEAKESTGENLKENVSMKIMKAVKSADSVGPWSVVAIKNKKVIAQELVKIRDLLPAAFKVMKKENPGAMISIEDDQINKRLFVEGLELTEVAKVYYMNSSKKIVKGEIKKVSGETFKLKNGDTLDAFDLEDDKSDIKKPGSWAMIESAEVNEEEHAISEGVDDPSIFKAIFLAGGPGSGKSFVVDKSGIPALGMKVVNSDKAFEVALEKAGKLKEPIDIEDPEVISLRSGAKKLTTKQLDLWLSGRLGLVIDGTGKNYSKVTSQAESLKKMGYDVAMIFVNTDLETALERNKMRSRTLPDSDVKDMWQAVQNNIGKFQNFFGNNFVVVDSSQGSQVEKILTSTYKKFMSWTKKEPKSPIAKKWIEQQRGMREAKKLQEATATIKLDRGSSMEISSIVKNAAERLEKQITKNSGKPGLVRDKLYDALIGELMDRKLKFTNVNEETETTNVEEDWTQYDEDVFAEELEMIEELIKQGLSEDEAINLVISKISEESDLDISLDEAKKWYTNTRKYKHNVFGTVTVYNEKKVGKFVIGIAMNSFAGFGYTVFAHEGEPGHTNILPLNYTSVGKYATVAEAMDKYREVEERIAKGVKSTFKLVEDVETELTEKYNFKVGATIYHKDFGKGKTPLKIVKVRKDNKLYNTADGVSGIDVTPEGDLNIYSIYFDTETFRLQNRPTGVKSDSYKKIVKLVEDVETEIDEAKSVEHIKVGKTYKFTNDKGEKKRHKVKDIGYGDDGEIYIDVEDGPRNLTTYVYSRKELKKMVKESSETLEDTIDEKKMRQADKVAAAKYRKKNKLKLKKYYKKRAKKIKAGTLKVNKSKSRAIKKARKKPGFSESVGLNESINSALKRNNVDDYYNGKTITLKRGTIVLDAESKRKNIPKYRVNTDIKAKIVGHNTSGVSNPKDRYFLVIPAENSPTKKDTLVMVIDHGDGLLSISESTELIAEKKISYNDAIKKLENDFEWSSSESNGILHFTKYSGGYENTFKFDTKKKKFLGVQNRKSGRSDSESIMKYTGGNKDLDKAIKGLNVQEEYDMLSEPAVSKSQQALMGMALAYKRGEMPEDEASDKVKELAKNMSEKDLEDFAKTKHSEIDEARKPIPTSKLKVGQIAFLKLGPENHKVKVLSIGDEIEVEAADNAYNQKGEKWKVAKAKAKFKTDL